MDFEEKFGRRVSRLTTCCSFPHYCEVLPSEVDTSTCLTARIR